METLIERVEQNYKAEEVQKFNKIIEALNLLKEKTESKKAFATALNKGKRIAQILFEVQIDFDALLASLVLDLMRNNLIKKDDLELNKAVYTLVDAVIKIENTIYKNNQADVDNLRAMFVAMSKDIRVLIIKLADILDTARNSASFTTEHKDYLHKQIKEIYAPLAARLGLSFIKSELQDENFKYLQPKEYSDLAKDLFIHEKTRKLEIAKVIKKIKRLLITLKIDGEVKGRVKHISSVYKKLQDRVDSLDQMYDLSAIRIIVKDVNACYAVLGAVHTMYTPMENKFKDYIAKPKENGYQSLHTVVYIDNKEPLEVQIRTEEMHNNAEYGIAAHWLYKEKRAKGTNLDQKLTWIRQIIENKESLSADELLETLKSDVYSEEIFVQTPKGNIISLPLGSTPIDFAYNIHSDIGNKCVGAKINGKMMPLNTTLNNGETVEIITSSSAKGPSRDWLKFVKSSSAKNKIGAFFKKERKEENIKKGKLILEQQAKIKKLPLHKLLEEKYLNELFERYSLANLDDMYASLGYGGVTSAQVLNKLQRSYEEHNAAQKLQEVVIRPQSVLEKAKQVKNDAIIIKGLDNVLTKFAKCCTPIPGDEIIAYISRGKGATIHRKNCKTLHHTESERLVEAEWGNVQDTVYIAEFNIVAKNIIGILANITNKIAELKINIVSISANQIGDDKILINVLVTITQKDQLSSLMTKLNSLSNVYEVYRANDN
ncbi:MAG: bifunctional (p)ppGpp synthetase/guanosine-3',5'-bis(diphosphate) 3'-pyrophosphohydrolase [Spirochaetales bacterium]